MLKLLRKKTTNLLLSLQQKINLILDMLNKKQTSQMTKNYKMSVKGHKIGSKSSQPSTQTKKEPSKRPRGRHRKQTKRRKSIKKEKAIKIKVKCRRRVVV